MLLALDSKQQLVLANSLSKLPKSQIRKQQWQCPGCRQPVIFKAGAKLIAHFAHRSAANCRSFSEGETKEHLLGKQQLWQKFKTKTNHVSLEAVIPECAQRADVLVSTPQNYRLAVEFQCAPLSATHLAQRTAGYQQQGIKVLWLLGKRHTIKKFLTQQQAMFMRYHSNLGFYLLYYDVTRRMFELIYEIQTCDFAPVRYCRFQTSSLVKLHRFWQTPHRKVYPPLTAMQRKRQLQQFYQTISQPSVAVHQLAQAVYLLNETLPNVGEQYLSSHYGAPLFNRWQFYWRVQQYVAHHTKVAPTPNSLYQLPLLNNHAAFLARQEQLRQACAVAFNQPFSYT